MGKTSACWEEILNQYNYFFLFFSQHDYEFEGDIGVDADANGDSNHIDADADADAGDNVDDKDPQGWRRERPLELFEDDLVEGEVTREQVQDQDGGGEIKQILNNQ